jgi:hypothetical protein
MDLVQIGLPLIAVAWEERHQTRIHHSIHDGSTPPGDPGFHHWPDDMVLSGDRNHGGSRACPGQETMGKLSTELAISPPKVSRRMIPGSIQVLEYIGRDMFRIEGSVTPLESLITTGLQ